MQLQNFYAQDVNGNIVPGAICSLFLPGTTTLATGLVDVNGASLTNPFPANSDGLVQFAAPNGKYDLKIEAGLIVSTLPITFADTYQALIQLGGFLPPSATPPTTRADGTPLQLGDRYMNTTDDLEYIYKTTGWEPNNLDGQIIGGPGGSALVGNGIRTQSGKNADIVSVRDYITTTIDGATANDDGIEEALNYAESIGAKLLWPAGAYVKTKVFANFWNVEHIGSGTLKSGATTYKFSQYGNQTNQLFVSPGIMGGDGLSVEKPLPSISDAVAIMAKFGKLPGRWQVIGQGGSYSEAVAIPDGLAQSANYLEFKFPSIPGVRTDPNSWPAGAATLNGTGLNVITGFTVGRYNKVYIEYLRFIGFYDATLTNVQQVRRAVSVDKFSFLYTHGCSYVGNGLANISVLPEGAAYVVGGYLRDARYGIDNTGGSLSLAADEDSYTVIDGALEYGLYQKHQSRSVLDYTEFRNCGKVAGASSYGCAILVYKSNASVDTRGCKFYRNNYAINLRGGFYAANPGIPDIYGTGADANNFKETRSCFGSNDLRDYQAKPGLDVSRGFGAGTTTGATTALAFDSNTTIEAGYFTATDQHLEVRIFGSNNAGGTAQVRPSFVTPGGVRYELANFQVAAGTNFAISLEIFTSSNGTVATVYYENTGATLGGTLTGQIIVNPMPFASEDLELQIWGDTSAANVLTVRRTRMERWG